VDRAAASGEVAVVFMVVMLNLAIVARSRLDVDQGWKDPAAPPSAHSEGGGRLDLPMMGRFRIQGLIDQTWRFDMNQSFNVQGMTCGHCERAVTQAVKAVDPQAEVKIDRPAGKVEVQTQQPREQIAQAIAQEGYQVQ